MKETAPPVSAMSARRFVMLAVLTALSFTPWSTRADVRLQHGTATFTQTIFHDLHPDKAIDGILDETGWAIARVDAFGGTNSETAVWETVSDLSTGQLTFFMHFVHSNPGHLLGRFRWSVTTDDRSTFADGLPTSGDVDANWVVLTHPSVSGPAGMTFSILPDDSILAGGTTAAQGVYTVSFSTALQGVTGIRLEALEHPSLPGGNGPGLFPRNGNFHLSELVLVAIPEPSTLLLFCVGLTGLIAYGHRRREGHGRCHRHEPATAGLGP